MGATLTRWALVPGPGRWMDQAHPSRPEDRLCPVVQSELPIDAGQVVPNRLMTDSARLGDGPNGLRLADHHQDVMLGGRQLPVLIPRGARRLAGQPGRHWLQQVLADRVVSLQHRVQSAEKFLDWRVLGEKAGGSA